MDTPTSPPPFSARNPLLVVRRGHAVTLAGGVTALIAIRALHDVSVAVHNGELVVLQGGVASGANTLFRVMCGERLLTAGVRTVALDVRLCRATISARAFAAIHRAWGAPHTTGVPRATETREGAKGGITRRGASRRLYLFRVRASSRDEQPSVMDDAWQAWAHVLRAQGGAVVACVAIPPARDARHVARVRSAAHAWASEAAAPAVPRAPFTTSTPRARMHRLPPATWATHVREAALAHPYRAARAGSRMSSLSAEASALLPASVRRYTLAGGQLISADPATRRWLTDRNDEDGPLGASHPSSTASTES